MYLWRKQWVWILLNDIRTLLITVQLQLSLYDGCCRVYTVVIGKCQKCFPILSHVMFLTPVCFCVILYTYFHGIASAITVLWILFLLSQIVNSLSFIRLWKTINTTDFSRKPYSHCVGGGERGHSYWGGGGCKYYEWLLGHDFNAHNNRGWDLKYSLFYSWISFKMCEVWEPWYDLFLNNFYWAL